MKAVLVLANDAGGAEILSAMVRAESSEYSWTVVTPAGSPASRIFKGGGTNVRILAADPQELSANFLLSLGADLVVFNPGRHSFPRSVARELRRTGLTTIAVLDHWINFRERFGYPLPGWQDELPNFLAVCDSGAYEIAVREGFPNIIKLRNYRITEQIERCREFEREQTELPGSLLFLSQTVGAPPGDADGLTDFGSREGQVIQEIGERFEAISRHFRLNELVIRLHPAEQRFHFSVTLDAYPALKYRVEYADDRELPESIAKAGLVVGMNSMALMVAFACGRPSVSVMPDPRVRCALPLPGKNCINHINQLLESEFSEFGSSDLSVNFFPECHFRGVVAAVSA